MKRRDLAPSALAALLFLLVSVLAAPIHAAEGELRWSLHVTLAFIWGVGPRVEESGANLIPGFAYSAPMEDLKLKAR